MEYILSLNADSRSASQRSSIAGFETERQSNVNPSENIFFNIHYIGLKMVKGKVVPVLN
jgi:hypothetical protein